MSALICGSLAFDTITSFAGKFAQQIMPEQLHILNVSFLVPTLRREFGGCAGNIAYNLKALGGTPLVLATVGPDCADYLTRLEEQGIRTELIRTQNDSHTAQAIIITDHDHNQITAFHPGAMQCSHLSPVPTDNPEIRIAIVSPDGRQAMLTHAQQLAQAGIPFVFDPGQGLPMFSGSELAQFIAQASWVTCNDYEAKMLCERMDVTLAQLSQSHLRGVIVTLAEAGCDVWQQGVKTHIPGTKAAEVLDPTGCGDAFRAALLFGLEQGWSLERCAVLGNRMGALKIAHLGGQNHQVDCQSVLQGV
jgi:adenosine kinase